MVAINLNKQQALDPDPKAIQQINFIGNLDQAGNMFFIIEEAKETILTCEDIANMFYNIFCFNIK